jgi:predicted Zn-dependent protease
MTGISLAGAVGTALVDSRFSREAEQQADRFAFAAAQRMGFEPTGLADLLERVANDDDYSRALALLSTHPLTAERREALELLRKDAGGPVRPAFSADEWQAIKTMCTVPVRRRPPAASGKAGDKTNVHP